MSAVKGLENGYISLPKSLFPTRDGDLFVIANGRSMIDNAHEERQSQMAQSYVCADVRNPTYDGARYMPSAQMTDS